MEVTRQEVKLERGRYGGFRNTEFPQYQDLKTLAVESTTVAPGLPVITENGTVAWPNAEAIPETRE